MFRELTDIKGDVRGDGEYYSLKSFIRPFDPLIMEIASVLNMSGDPIKTAQDFVHKVVKYGKQDIEYWRYPAETLDFEEGETTEADCDCMAVLLCSILRNYLPAEDVYVAVGNLKNGSNGGHAWVVCRSKIVESTVSSGRKIDESKYQPEVLFNDQRAYAVSENGFGFIKVAGINLKVE